MWKAINEAHSGRLRRVLRSQPTRVSTYCSNGSCRRALAIPCALNSGAKSGGARFLNEAKVVKAPPLLLVGLLLDGAHRQGPSTGYSHPFNQAQFDQLTALRVVFRSSVCCKACFGDRELVGTMPPGFPLITFAHSSLQRRPEPVVDRWWVRMVQGVDGTIGTCRSRGVWTPTHLGPILPRECNRRNDHLDSNQFQE
jgi:hypothetical protein